jgi:hypothetical protein
VHMLLCLRVEMLSDDDAVRTGGEFWISYVRLVISQRSFIHDRDDRDIANINRRSLCKHLPASSTY